MDRNVFLSLLGAERDWIVVWLSAPWCKFCVGSEPSVQCRMNNLRNDITVLHLNIDKSPDLYAVLRSKKQVRGIPALLAYKPGNTTYFADASCVGAQAADLDAFYAAIK